MISNFIKMLYIVAILWSFAMAMLGYYMQSFALTLVALVCALPDIKINTTIKNDNPNT